MGLTNLTFPVDNNVSTKMNEHDQCMLLDQGWIKQHLHLEPNPFRRIYYINVLDENTLIYQNGAKLFKNSDPSNSASR